jgi:hypothetical protein
VKIAVVAMLILTAVCIGSVAYTYATPTAVTDEYPDNVYAAFRYEEEPPYEPYELDGLGIIEVVEYGSGASLWLHIIVAADQEPFPLTIKRPIFRYKDTNWQVSELYATPGLTDSQKGTVVAGATLVMAVGWISTGCLYYKKRE